MHAFQQFITNYTSITPKDWQVIEPCLKEQFYPKGSILLKEGKICKKIYFLERGLLRYFVWKDGTDISKFFTQPPYCFTSQRSYNLNILAQESIEALEDNYIYEILKEDAERLFELSSWSTFVRKLVQEVQFFTEQILVEIQNEIAEERYQSILSNSPKLKHHLRQV